MKTLSKSLKKKYLIMGFVFLFGILLVGVLYIFRQNLFNYLFYEPKTVNLIFSNKKNLRNQMVAIGTYSEKIKGDEGIEELIIYIYISAVKKKVAGVDISLSYNKDVLEFLEVMPTNVKLSNLMPLSLFKNSQEGNLVFSLLASGGDYFQPKNNREEIAYIKFKMLKPQTSEIKFNFRGVGATNDTNIAEFGTGRDILTNVFNSVEP